MSATEWLPTIVAVGPIVGVITVKLVIDML